MASERTVRVRLMADVADYVRNMNRAAKITDDMSKAEKKAERERAERAREQRAAYSAVSNSLLGVGAAATVGLVAAVKGFADFDAAMSGVKATGEDAARNIDALRQAAMEAGREFGQFSAKDAAEGIEELAKAGLSATQILNGGLNGALSLAAAGQIEVANAAEITARTLAQFHLEGEKASHVADLLAAGAGKAVGEVDDFALALKQGGTVAAQFGVSVEETVGTLALFAQNALAGSDGGTSLKTMLISLANPSKKAAQTMEELGIRAYDAQGKFVGIANLADQLKTNMEGLTQAQRDQALATIFGSDAIRAAQILYANGGDAVRDWTQQVDDAGYAAQVAATKMDNLQGDLKALGGSWETLTIKMGSGANSPIRNAVQDLTGFVDALAEMPDGVQQVIISAGGLVAATALIGGGFMKAVTGAVELRDAYASLAADSPKLAAGFRNAAIAAGILTVALMAASAIDSTIIDTRLVDGLAQSTTGMLAVSKASSTTVKSLQDVQKASQTASVELDKFFLNDKGKGVAQNVDGIDSAFRRLNPTLQSSVTRFEDLVNKGFGKVTGISSETSRLTAGFTEMDKALAGLASNGAAKQASEAFQMIAQSADKNKVSTEQLLALFPAYKAGLQSQANELAKQVKSFDASTLSAEDYAKWMKGEVPAAVQKAAAAAKAAGKDIAGLGTDLENTGESAEQARDNMLGFMSVMLQLAGSEVGAAAALADFNKGLKENGNTIDNNTEKGRANRTNLINLAGAHLSLIDNLKKTDASSAQVAKAQSDMRVALEGAISKMGLSSAQAEEMRTKLGLVKLETDELKIAYDQLPAVKRTEVSAPGARPSKSEVDAFMKSVTGLPAEKKTAIRTIAELSGVDAAKRALASVQSKTVYVTVKQQLMSLPSMPGLPQTYRAAGGPVFGPGSATSDSIPLWASNGEYVLRTWAASRVGYDVLDWINRHGTLPPRHNTGGQAGIPARPMPSIPTLPTYPLPQATSTTFAPQITAYGLDPHTVVNDAMTSMRHEMRVAAIPGLGGTS